MRSICVVDAIYVAGRSVQGNYFAWHTGDNSMVGDIVSHDRVGANRDIVADFDAADEDGSRTDIDIVANGWTALARAAIALPDSDTVRQVAVAPEHGVWIDHDSSEVANIQTRTDTSGVGNRDAVPNIKPCKFE